MSLKYGIIGSGAIGGYYGAALAKSGKEVHFLFHSDYEYVKQNGLKIDSINGNFCINPILAYSGTSDMPSCDVVIIALKSTNNHLLKDILPPLLHKDTLVILIQNGLGMEADLQSLFTDLSIAGAMAFICSNKIGEGHIAHLDQGSLNIGTYSCRNLSILKEVSDDLLSAGIETNMVDLEPARWKKLIWNIPYNGLSVVLNTKTDCLMKNIDSRSLINELMLDVIKAANHVGKGRFCLSEKLADEMLKTTDLMPSYSPSMKLDYDNRRTLEIEYIYSRPISVARQAGYQMLYTSMLEKQLQFLDRKNRL